ncbi:MAG: hypothetical protein R2713_08705 [Ilumatobacteraceae bacterium]
MSDGPDGQVFEQVEGPFTDYRRVVEVRDRAGPEVVDTTTYRLDIPWFGWLFRWPVRHALGQHRAGTGTPPAWAPPDRLTSRHVLVLGLLAAVSMPAAFVNTLFRRRSTSPPTTSASANAPRASPAWWCGSASCSHCRSPCSPTGSAGGG